MNLINKNFSNDLFNNSFFKETDVFKADIFEKDSIYKIVMDLPGFKKDNIKIDYDNGYITVLASKQDEKTTDTRFLHRERFYGEYKRTFYVGCVIEDSIKANYENGILTINLEKKNENNRRKEISIE